MDIGDIEGGPRQTGGDTRASFGVCGRRTRLFFVYRGCFTFEVCLGFYFALSVWTCEQ